MGPAWHAVCRYASIAGLAVATATPACAQSADSPLAPLLVKLARETGIELLFDEALVRNIRVRPVRKQGSPETKLRLLLANTGIGYRITPGKTFILFRSTATVRRPAQQVPDAAVPEILVIGRRSQNADIRRSENDIQPYKVVTSRDIRTGHRDNLDQLLRSRIPANADLVSPMQNFAEEPGATHSRIDLRGIGARRTLVLVDGRRMPGLPSSTDDFDQPDLNGIPLGAIDRVELLTSTSGGIYGPGAIGGVVNVVLRQDYEGAELAVTSGLSTRADAARFRLEGRVGLSSADGSTHAMIHAAYSRSDSLQFGQRDLVQRARAVAISNDATNFLFPSGLLSTVPPSGAVYVVSSDGTPLILDADKGGANLGSTVTFLPTDFQGSDEQRLIALQRNAGMATSGLSAGYSGARRSLLNNPATYSLIFSGKHRLAGDAVVFIDGLYFRNEGRSRSAIETGAYLVPADSANNPFNQAVFFNFPIDAEGRNRANIDVWRVVGGVNLPLPGGWKGGAEYVAGRSRYSIEQIFRTAAGSAYGTALRTGTSPDGRLPVLAPLGPWDVFQTSLDAYLIDDRVALHATNRFSDINLRLAGPIAELSGGPLSLSLLAEQRRETIKPTKLEYAQLPANLWTPHRGLKVQSGYAELRAPLMASDKSASPFNGLELQLAARIDRTRTTFPTIVNPFLEENPLTSLRRDAFMITAGARTFLLPNLMLRASYATGTVTPFLSSYQERQLSTSSVISDAPDPQRANRLLGSEGSYIVRSGGSHDLSLEAGDTISAGLVLNPGGGAAPRLSIDYSRIATRREIMAFPLGTGALLSSEKLYPDRVIRAPLTDADRALGFTAGRVIELDTRAINSGRTVVHAFDLQFDWRIAGVAGGDIAPYAKISWQPSIRTRTHPGERWIERSGYLDGPLEWRGSGGLRWSRRSLLVDLNMQYLDSYKVTAALAPDSVNEARLRLNGRSRVPAQLYFDISAGWKVDLPASGRERSLDVSFGVINILDHRPPFLANNHSIGYSAYGDPRRRRVELALLARF